MCCEEHQYCEEFRNNLDSQVAFLEGELDKLDPVVDALTAILYDLELHQDELPPIPAVTELWARGKEALATAYAPYPYEEVE